ncbi:MAG: protein TolR [Candidatus Paracaedibacteraceae bacterium]|nr:protein TolR [Candidatus Paracaedibacteraceae bacterium]
MAMGSINKPMSRGRRRQGAGFSEINVTPMVDVMLVLLIIFMVAAPMMTVGVPVDLPKTKAAQMNDQIEPIVISVDATGKTYLQETSIEGVELIARLMAVTSNNPEARIYVRGDQALAYGRVMEVMGEIAAAGFTKVSLIAEMPKGTAPIQHKPAAAKAAAHPRQQANVPTLQQMVPQPTRAPQAVPASRSPKMSPEQYPTGMLQHPPKR